MYHDITSYTKEELGKLLQTLGQPSFRAGQLFSWIHEKQVQDFSEMTNLPKALREELAASCTLAPLTIVEKRTSKRGDTIKYLLELADGERVETVLMYHTDRRSVCISTQVGCRMGCQFCASTGAGFVRNLTPGEMLRQVYLVGQDAGERITNVVLMGIGEPLDNFESVLRFLTLIHDPAGAGIGMRHITISTCGLVDRIDKLAQYKLALTLSVSLHAVDDESRNRLMPINLRFPIDKLLQSSRQYSKITGRRVSIEYALIAHHNDSLAKATALADLLRGGLFHVNLIPINHIPGNPFSAGTKQRMEAFQQTLLREGIAATVRQTMGSDIDAACGQLRRDAQPATSKALATRIRHNQSEQASRT